MKSAIPFMGLVLAIGTWADPPLKACDSEELRTAQVILLTGLNEDDGGKRGWFGVRLDVPGPVLSRQLGLEDNGLVVVNLGKDSPADRSGLQQYDVIISFDGQKAGHDISALADHILELGEGAEVDYVVLRNADELKLHVTLSTRPRSEDWDWKHKCDPISLFKQNQSIFGKMIHRAPDGKIIIDDLGRLPSMPPAFRLLIPKYHKRAIELWNEDGRTKCKCVIDMDDTTVEIEDGDDGEIIIRRIKPGKDTGAVQETIYANEEALNEGDREAYEACRETQVWRSAPKRTPNFLYEMLEPVPAPAPLPPDIKEDVAGKYAEKLKEWQDKLAATLKEAEEQLKHYDQGRLEEALRQAQNRIQEAVEQYKLGPEEPKYRFHEEPDGTIRVIIRKGDSELTKVYESAESLREENPSLFERYESVQASE